ncbi:hypothetical protein AA0112_g9997 [Alternaria arborescens]|nr:hypothetical protein AA0112_g9997 [Alternaria arborescens]
MKILAIARTQPRTKVGLRYCKHSSSRLHTSLLTLERFQCVWLVSAFLEPAPRPQANSVPDQPETARKRRASDVSLAQPSRPFTPSSSVQALYPYICGIPDSSARAALRTVN